MRTNVLMLYSIDIHKHQSKVEQETDGPKDVRQFEDNNSDLVNFLSIALMLPSPYDEEIVSAGGYIYELEVSS